MTDKKEYLSLKWGSLKAWKLNEGGPAYTLMAQYLSEPISMSAMLQRDTDNEKRLILEIIDVVDADEIYLDWDGKYVSKEDAKEYVLNYGKN
jgi:hypothetical protein